MAALEIVTPYDETNLRTLHYTQSVDVLFLFHPKFRERRINHLSDQNWVLTDITHNPPPSIEADFDISDPTATAQAVGGGEGGPGVAP